MYKELIEGINMAKILCFFPNGGTRINKGNADIYQVLNGNIFSNSKNLDIVGAMPNRGAWNSSNLQPSSSVTIPDGYHNGSGYVQAASLDSQWNIIKNKWGITADKIKKGVWIGDVQGTFEIILPPSPFTICSSYIGMGGDSKFAGLGWTFLDGSTDGGHTASYAVACSKKPYDLTYYNSITAVWGALSPSRDPDILYNIPTFYGLTKDYVDNKPNYNISFVRTAQGISDQRSVSSLNVSDLSGSYYISYWTSGSAHIAPMWMNLNR